MKDQSNTLRLADELDGPVKTAYWEAAAELRRLAEVEAELDRLRDTNQAMQKAFNKAIDFAIEEGSGAAVFLRCWREGDTSEWPEFEADMAKGASISNQVLIPVAVANRVLSALGDLLPDPKDKNHGGYGAQDVSRWRAAAADLRKTLKAEHQAPSQPCIACGNEAGHSESCARVRWGVALPEQRQQSEAGQQFEPVLREALAWGKVYGAELSGTAWDTMREEMVKTLSARAVTSLEASGVPHG